ncbi:aldo/keto reductase [Rothia amarae]|uniref:aldo/keto reductase n=1 Tax=Rothia amarae TaxID=169480 RepID=UPI0033DCF3FE
MNFQPSLIPEGDQQVDLHAQLEELLKLREEGKVLSIGLSHVTLEQVKQAEKEIGIASVSNIYTVLRRDDEPILDFAQAHEIAWTPYSPLGGVSYADIPRVTEHTSVQRIAEELGATANQVGIKWQLEHSPNTLLIMGTSSLHHLKENVAATSLSFTSEQFEELENLT